MTRPDRDPRIAELVGIARELALVAGYEAAEALMLHFGGQRLYVPRQMRPKSVIWKALGADAAKALAAIVDKRPSTETTVDVPIGGKLMAARRREAIEGFRGSKNQAAAVFRCSRRTVQRYRKGRRVGIGPLFDGPSKQP